MTATNEPTLMVTGATGELGRRVMDELLVQVPAERLVAGVRDPEHAVARRLAARGVCVRVADYDRPDVWPAALVGVHRLLLISSNAVGERQAQHRTVIEAAARAGVSLLAYTSMLRADTTPIAMAEDHVATERMLRESGVPHVLLRHGWYMDNHLQSVPTALERGEVYGSAGDGRFATAMRADFAAANAAVLAGEGHAGRTYELAGSRSYTLADFAGSIAAAAGRPETYVDMPQPAFADLLARVGLPPAMAHMIADADTGAAAGWLEDDGGQLEALISRPPTTLEEAVAQAVAAC